jgi:hypothetical protein
MPTQRARLLGPSAPSRCHVAAQVRARCSSAVPAPGARPVGQAHSGACGCSIAVLLQSSNPHAAEVLELEFTAVQAASMVSEPLCRLAPPVLRPPTPNSPAPHEIGWWRAMAVRAAACCFNGRREPLSGLTCAGHAGLWQRSRTGAAQLCA